MSQTTNESGKIQKRLKGLSEILKTVGGILGFLPPIAAWLDPTFFGILNINPFIAKQSLPISIIAFVVALVALFAWYRTSLRLEPQNRVIGFSWTFALLAIAVVLVFIIGFVTAYLDANSPTTSWASRSWEILLTFLYVSFVSTLVLALGRLALRLCPAIR